MEKSYDPLSSETDGQTFGAVCSYKGSQRGDVKKRSDSFGYYNGGGEGLCKIYLSKI